MKVLITRPRSQARDFADRLSSAGFEPVFFPVIEICPLTDNPELDQALNQLEKYEWIVFTSVNGVDVVFDHLPSAPRLPRVGAIGPKTAEALRAHGVQPDFVPQEYVAESILPGLGDVHGKRILLPRAEIARQALPEAIARAGGTAHQIAVYRTLPAEPDQKGLAALKSGVDWITFTSPSTVRNFVEFLRRQEMNPFELKNNPKVACIGPITKQAAKEAGFEVALVAETYTTEGLINALQSA